MKSNALQKIEDAASSDLAADKENISFSSLGLGPDLCKIVAALGYEVPTPIQRKGIPILLSGRDLIGQAQTGTGKTAAFALPIISKINFDLQEPQALVLTPTRELAIQVAEAFQIYARGHETFHVLPIYGGQSIGIQLRQLKRNPQVIVGTPGRVMDHLRRESLSLTSLKALVIDEADEMMSMGFLEDMEWIIAHTPKEKQTTLFSATMPKAIRRIAQKYLKEPEEIMIRQVASEAALITQSCWFVNGVEQKVDALTRILEMNDFDAMLIFVRTKNSAVEVAEKLEARGYSAGALNGDMSQDIRERTIGRLKQGRLDILVATDVAARGLDVERISHVINFDIPFDAETYTHRIGRTGRAGRSGTAVLFVSAREQGLLRIIERGTGVRLEKFPMPSREELDRRTADRFRTRVSEKLKGEIQPDLSEIDFLLKETGTTEKQIAAALFALLKDTVQEQTSRKSSPETRQAHSDEPRPQRREWSKHPPGRDGRPGKPKKAFGKRKPRQ